MPKSRFAFFQLPWRSKFAIARDVDAELAFDIEMRVKALRDSGLDAAAAEARARQEFGDLEFTRAYCRDLDERSERETRLSDHIAAWKQDAAYALRTLRRSPGYAAVSLLTLTLAIGANTAIFSVARAVLLAPLPYGEPSALVGIYENWPENPTSHTPLSPANFVDYQAQQHAFTDIGAYVGMGAVTWRRDNADPEAISALGVGPNLFGVLQVPALHGRTFAPGDEVDGNDHKAVISYRLWQRALGGDPAAIGKRYLLNNRQYDIIGVMPRGFTMGWDEDIYMPVDMKSESANTVVSRKQHWVQVVGRIKAGVALEAARSDLLVISHRLAAQYPEADAGRFALIVPLHDVLVGDLRPAILLLQSAAGMVLLIACANLANLTLSRTLARRRELAVRAALGAGRARLARQLVTESVILAITGGVLGVAFAAIASRALLATNPDALPTSFHVGVDGGVLLFSLGVSVAAGVLFGVAPALGAARADLHDSLKEGGRSASGGRASERLRRGLVVAQVGLALMLLIGAGLLTRSFRELTRVQLGFDPDHVLSAQLRASGAFYDSAATVNHFYDAVLGEIAAAPGVVAVGAASNVPMRGRVNTSLRIEGQPVDEKHLPDLGYVGIRGDYFKAMRIPLKAGRLYDASDGPNGPKNVIVNETTARRFFPNGDAVGHRIRIGPNPQGEWMTIIGVVGDVRDESADVPAKPTMYGNHRQETWERSLAVMVRTEGDPLTAAAAIRRAVKDADPSLAVRDMRTLNDVVGGSFASRRFALGLASCFAIVALVLAAVGIYGVLAYMVTTRTREFGVRLALGASARSVLMLVVRQGLTWSVLGVAIGVGGALAGGRVLQRMLYGVTPVDAWTYASVVTVLLAVVGAACLVPAARATRVDPLTSMRAD